MLQAVGGEDALAEQASMAASLRSPEKNADDAAKQGCATELKVVDLTLFLCDLFRDCLL